MELLESRCLLAQVLFGGNVLKETFDDLDNLESPPGQALVPEPPYNRFDQFLDDRGRLCTLDPALGTTTCQQTPAVFHHRIPGTGFIQWDSGTTTGPPNGPHSLVSRYGTDQIRITPFLPPGATTAEVALVSIDVKRPDEFGALVSFVGERGQVSLRGPALSSPLQPRVISNNPSCGPGSCFTAVIGPPPSLDLWDSYSVSENTPSDHDSNVKIGPIQHIWVLTVDELQIDNLRALVFFPGIAQPPLAQDDTYILPPGWEVGKTYASRDLVPAVGEIGGSVLANDGTPNRDAAGLPRPLQARLVTPPSHGNVTLAPDGNFSYQPHATFAGTDQFSYVANDTTADSSIVLVKIVARASHDDADGDGVLDAVELQAGSRGDSNNDGGLDYLQSNVVSLRGADRREWTLVTSDGSFSWGSKLERDFLPLPQLPNNVLLASPLFDFQVRDVPPGGSAIVTITPGGFLTDRFFEFDPSAQFRPGAPFWADFPSDPGKGVRANVSANQVELHLVDGLAGDLDADRNGVITVLGGTPRFETVEPFANNLIIQLPSHQDLTEPVPGQVTATGESLAFDKVLGSEVGGFVDFDRATNSFVFHPDDTMVAVADGMRGGFVYQVTDPNGATSFGSVAITIPSTQPDRVIANDDFAVISQRPTEPSVTFNWRRNDVHPADRGAGDLHPLTLASFTQPAHGEVVMDDVTGTAIYRPEADFLGRDSFIYTITDGTGDTDTAVAFLDVIATFAPVAFSERIHPNHFQTGEEVIGVQYEDLDGDSVSPIIVDPPTRGTIERTRTVRSDTGATYVEFDYKPRSGIFGASDRFSYKLNDGLAESNVATVDIVVSNAAPVAEDDPWRSSGCSIFATNTICEHEGGYVIPSYYSGMTVRFGGPDASGAGLLQNDSDEDGDPLHVVLVEGPENGSVTLESDGTFTYLPAAGFTGHDSFKYKASDGFLESNVATVKLYVANPPQIRYITIDRSDINDSHRSNIESVEVAFNEDFIAIDSHVPSFALEQQDASGSWRAAPVELQVFHHGVESHQVEFAYGGVPLDSLPDGQYRLSVLSNGIYGWYGLGLDGNFDGVPGDNAVYEFSRRFGDEDGDGSRDGLGAQNFYFPLGSGGELVTLSASPGTTLYEAHSIANPSPGNAPSGVSFPAGFYEFQVIGVDAQGLATVTLTAPPGIAFNTYYKYGPTPDDRTPHWYRFLYDGQTGAEIDGNVLVLHFLDGRTGDSDLRRDGVITDPGGLALILYWRNTESPFDANADTFLTPFDALVIINDLNRAGSRKLDAPPALGQVPPYLDVNGDGFVSPQDVLVVVNRLNQPGGTAEGEEASGQFAFAVSVVGGPHRTKRRTVHYEAFAELEDYLEPLICPVDDDLLMDRRD